MESDSWIFWILCEMFSWHKIMLLSQVGVKIEGRPLKAADLQWSNEKRTACFWFLVYKKACACVFLGVLQKLFCWSWCLALNHCWLEAEKGNEGYWQERSVLWMCHNRLAKECALHTHVYAWLLGSIRSYAQEKWLASGSHTAMCGNELRARAVPAIAWTSINTSSSVRSLPYLLV